MTADSSRTLDGLADIARLAGDAILDVYASAFDVRHKGDGSPVTLADTRAEAIITAALRSVFPGVPVVAEEAASRGEAPPPERVAREAFWLVDPLDGTREFAARNGEFTVNIGLVEGGRPTLGVVFAPALDRLFAGAVGTGAWLEERGRRRPIACRRPPGEGPVLALSRSHGDGQRVRDWLGDRPVGARVHAGSSLKFGLLAAGEADLYPRFGRTMEWDTAAGHAVLAAAGGAVETVDGRPLAYGKPHYENPDFIARGHRGDDAR